MGTNHAPKLPTEIYIKGGRIQHDFCSGYQDSGVVAFVAESRFRSEEICNAMVTRYNSHDALVEALRSSIETCREALSDEWDRSDQGFEDWIHNLEQTLKSAGVEL